MGYLVVFELLHQVAGKDVGLLTAVDIGQSIVTQLVDSREPRWDRVATEVHLLDQDVVDRLFGLWSTKEDYVSFAVFRFGDRNEVILHHTYDPLTAVFCQRVTLDLYVVSNQ